MPLSQIHYHFGGRQGLLLGLLAQENERLLERQEAMYAADAPLWQRYELACDYLEDDLASGYVRLLQEMIAAGWSDSVIGEQVTTLQTAWFALLEKVIGDSGPELDLGPFSARDIATLVGLGFMGGESMLLLDRSWAERVIPALRAVATALKSAAKRPGRTVRGSAIRSSAIRN